MPVRTFRSLTRRRSSALSSKCINSPRPQKVSAVYSGCTIPAEILEAIVSYAYSSDRSFASISGFATASFAFRQIALRCFCSHLHICSVKRWAGMPDAAKLSGWTRSISASAHALSAPSAVQLRSFHLLRSVHITFHGHSIVNYSPALYTLLEYLPGTITELSLLDLPDISPSSLNVIAKKFTDLTSLELSCTERLDDSCCWGCFEESASCVNHSPVPDVFPTVGDMTTYVKTALRPLTKLQHLHLGFFLSPTGLIYEHLSHAQEQVIYPAFEVNYDSEGEIIDDDETIIEDEINSPSSASNRDAVAEAEASKPFGPEWCLLCFERHATTVRLSELQAGLEFAQALKELKTLGWGSFFGRQKQEMSSRRTSIWVFRKDGKIRVRRKPWLIK